MVASQPHPPAHPITILLLIGNLYRRQRAPPAGCRLIAECAGLATRTAIEHRVLDAPRRFRLPTGIAVGIFENLIDRSVGEGIRDRYEALGPGGHSVVIIEGRRPWGGRMIDQHRTCRFG